MSHGQMEILKKKTHNTVIIHDRYKLTEKD